MATVGVEGLTVPCSSQDFCRILYVTSTRNQKIQIQGRN